LEGATSPEGKTAPLKPKHPVGGGKPISENRKRGGAKINGGALEGKKEASHQKKKR